MAKNRGDIQCVNDGKAIHVIQNDNGKGLCGDADYNLNRNYYGRKNKVIWRNMKAITCEKCKELYELN